MSANIISVQLVDLCFGLQGLGRIEAGTHTQIRMLPCMLKDPARPRHTTETQRHFCPVYVLGRLFTRAFGDDDRFDLHLVLSLNVTSSYN